MRYSIFATLLATASSVNAQTLVEVLQSQPDLSTLLELVTLVPGLADTLQGSSNITILAPTNQAFATIQPDIPESIAVANRNVSSVAGLLANHVIQGSYPASAFTNVPVFVQTLLNTSFGNDIQPFTNTTGGQYIGGILNGQDVNILSGEFGVSNVTMADIRVGDGIIVHVVDRVLTFGAPFQLYAGRADLDVINQAIQAAGFDNSDGVDSEGSLFNEADKTIFVPANMAFELIGSVVNGADQATLRRVLEYHVLDEIIFSPSITNTSIPSPHGEDLTFTVGNDGSVYVNQARVIFPNIILWNGVAHVIDNVLNPDAPELDRASFDFSQPSSARTMFPSATSTNSFPWATFSVPTGESYSIAPIYTTAAAVSLPSASTTGVPMNSSTAAPSMPVYTGGAVRTSVVGSVLGGFAASFLAGVMIFFV